MLKQSTLPIGRCDVIVKFELDLKPLSINQTYYGNRAIKTKEARAWEQSIYTELVNIHELTKLADAWRAQGGIFRIRINFVHPSGVFYNEAGVISARSYDISNCEKSIIDCIFRRMKVDDRFLQRMVSQKVPGVDWQIAVKIQLIV